MANLDVRQALTNPALVLGKGCRSFSGHKIG